jgi:hypothetical protein
MWIRVCVDVDEWGQVNGLSAEHHDDNGQRDGLSVYGHGPFDTPAEAFAECLRRAVDTYGLPMRLFD